MRLLIVGLDGATWKIADPLLAQGRLPNMARLIRDGARATLYSLEPILSPILWTDIATGKLPQKHGVTRYFHTASNLRTKRLWDILERPDRPIGLWSWPVTWPPRPITGFIIPSLFARSDDTYPRDLRFVKELEAGMDRGWRERTRLIREARRHGLRTSTGLKIARYTLNQKLGKYNELDRHINLRYLKLETHLDIYTSLVRSYRPYFTSFYLNQTDALAHRFWRYYEPELFPNVPAQDIEKYGNVIPEAYEWADRALGRLLELTDGDTLVIVLSDHGFQAESREGKSFYPRVLGDRLLAALDLDDVLYVNYRRYVMLELAEPRPDIVEKLKQLQVTELGQRFLELDIDADGRITCGVFEFGRYQDIPLEELKDFRVVWPGGDLPFLDLVSPQYNERQSGTHALDGIGIFYGPGVQPGGHVTDASILDVVPTALALLGMPVGQDMDGRVLTEAIAPEFLIKTPVTFIDTYDSGLEFGESTDEEDLPPELLSRLRALGYVE